MARSDTRRRRQALAAAIVIAAAIVVLNAVGVSHRRQLAALRAPAGALPVSAELAASGRIRWIVGDVDGSVHVLDAARIAASPLEEDSRPLHPIYIAKSRALETAPVSMAVDNQLGLLYVADRARCVRALDDALETAATFEFPGQVSGVAALTGGGLAVCYGLSGYGPDYFVSVVRDPLHETAPKGVATGFATRLLTSAGDGAVFGTVNSRVGKVSRAGTLLWKRVLPQRPMAIAGASSGLVAVGDERGTLTVLNSDGELVGRHKASRFALGPVAFSPAEDFILIADKKGTLFVYDTACRLLCRVPARVETRPLTAFLGAGRDTIALCGSRELERIRLSTTAGLRWSAGFRTAHVVGNCLLIVLFVVAIIGGNARLLGAVKGLGVRLHAGRHAYFLLAPTFCLLLVFNYYPALTALLYSFTKFSLSSPIEFIGLANFREMTHDPYVWVGVRNMFIFLSTGLIKTLTVPLLVAELVFWLGNDRLRQVLRTSYVVPAVVPGLVTILLWKMIFNPSIGLLNQTLVALGFSGFENFAWLGHEKLAIWSIVLSGLPWVNIFAFLILLGGLININRDIYEAGAIDGISVWQRFWRIDLPLIVPQIKLLIVFVFIGSVQDFTNVLVFTGGGPGKSTYVPALQMFYQTAEGANLGYAAAIGVTLFAVVFGATVLNLKFIRAQES